MLSVNMKLEFSVPIIIQYPNNLNEITHLNVWRTKVCEGTESEWRRSASLLPCVLENSLFYKSGMRARIPSCNLKCVRQCLTHFLRRTWKSKCGCSFWRRMILSTKVSVFEKALTNIQFSRKLPNILLGTHEWY